MFNALQEGIIVIADKEIQYMNELSNLCLTELGFFKKETTDAD